MVPTAHKLENVWQPSAFKRYGVAVLAVALTVGVRLALDPILGSHAPYLPFAIAIILASRYGGRGPGVAATALSTFGVEYFLIEPRYSLAIADLNAAAGLALFVVVGVVISLLVGQLRQTLIAGKRPSRIRESEELVPDPGQCHSACVGWRTRTARLRYNSALVEYTEPSRAMEGWAGNRS